MKKNKIKLACAVLALLILYTSCDLLTLFSGKDEDTEPTYTPDIAWTLETQCVWPYTQEVQHGQYLYIIESTYMYSPPEPEEFNIAKIDLKTGKYVWKSPTVAGVESSSVIKSNDNLFIQTSNGLLYCFNDADGTLNATIQLTYEEMPVLQNILAYDDYLYWGNLGNNGTNRGLMRFDTRNLNFSQPNTVQLLHPELIYKTTPLISALPIVDKGIIYVLTYNKYYGEDKGVSSLIAIDAATNTRVWQNDFIFTEEGFPIAGYGVEPLYIVGDNIHVIDSAIGCYNKNTGETVYEERQNYEDFMHEVALGVGIFATTITYSDAKFYYVAQTSHRGASIMGYPEEYNKNIICIDATNGKYLWGDMPPYSGTLATTPLVVNGKCYVLSHSGLRVYNANTGKLLGTDKSVKTNGYDRPSQYDDMFIYFDVYTGSGVGLLTAIHAR